MARTIRAGINTTKDQFDYVFSSKTREALSELVTVDYSLIPEQATPESIRRSIEGAEVIFGTWGSLPYTKYLLDACPDLELILYGAGSFKALVTPELISSGVAVCTAVHINAQPVAEFTLGIILTSLKNVFDHDRRFKRDGRQAWSRDKAYNGGYYHTRIGLLGYGRITRILIDLLSRFDFEVFVADDFLAAEEAEACGVVKTDIEEIMRTCDVVSIHHADVERNWKIINRSTLELMKPGARLINTSRGRMIDEDDLVDALRKGSITAFLDVTYPEPPEEGHPFYELPNCILTPHIAGSVGAEVSRMGDYCLRELKNWLTGSSLENRIDIGDQELRA
jgi:phosphoglycerate dehydrogenase-like enzyme